MELVRWNYITRQTTITYIVLASSLVQTDSASSMWLFFKQSEQPVTRTCVASPLTTNPSASKSCSSLREENSARLLTWLSAPQRGAEQCQNLVRHLEMYSLARRSLETAKLWYTCWVCKVVLTVTLLSLSMCKQAGLTGGTHGGWPIPLWVRTSCRSPWWTPRWCHTGMWSWALRNTVTALGKKVYCLKIALTQAIWGNWSLYQTTDKDPEVVGISQETRSIERNNSVRICLGFPVNPQCQKSV